LYARTPKSCSTTWPAPTAVSASDRDQAGSSDRVNERSVHQRHTSAPILCFLYQPDPRRDTPNGGRVAIFEWSQRMHRDLRENLPVL
jgi:hypothetical protein